MIPGDNRYGIFSCATSKGSVEAETEVALRRWTGQTVSSAAPVLPPVTRGFHLTG